MLSLYISIAAVWVSGFGLGFTLRSLIG